MDPSEATQVFLLLGHDYRISRSIRAQWFFEHLNTVVFPNPTFNTSFSMEELEVVYSCSKEKHADDDISMPVRVVPSTHITFLGRRYRFVFCLDLSESLSTVNLCSRQVTVDEIYDSLADCMRGLAKPLRFPGCKDALEPVLYITVLACSRPMHQFSEVLTHSFVLNESSLGQLLDLLRTHLDRLLTQRVEQDESCSMDHLTRMVMDGLNMLQLLPDNTSAGLVVVTDGVLSSMDLTVLDTVLDRLKAITVMCSFLLVGDLGHMQQSYTAVPNIPLLQLMALATSGSVIIGRLESGPIPAKRGMDELNVYHRSLLCWDFQHKQLEHVDRLHNCIVVSNGASPSDLLRSWSSLFLTSMLRQDYPLATRISSVLSLRLREGYSIDHVNISKSGNHVEVNLKLPWREDAFVEYIAKSAWPIDANKETQVTISLHTPPYYQNERSSSLPAIRAYVKRIKQTDSILVLLQSLSTDRRYYTLPSLIKEGASLFQAGPSQTNLRDTFRLRRSFVKLESLDQVFVQYWRNMMTLLHVPWQKWLHCHRIGIIVKYSHIPKGLFSKSEASAPLTLICADAFSAIQDCIKRWRSFELLEGNLYVRFLTSDGESRPYSFCLLKVVATPCYVLLRLGFLGGTAGKERQKVVGLLRDSLGALTFSVPQVPSPVLNHAWNVCSDLCLCTSGNSRASPKESPADQKHQCCYLVQKPLDCLMISQRSNRLVSLMDASHTDGRPSALSDVQQYLYRRRHAWMTSDSIGHGLSPKSQSKILFSLMKERLREGFLLAQVSSEFVCMILEVEMKNSFGVVHAQSVIQYLVYKSYDNPLSDAEGATTTSGTLNAEIWVEPVFGFCSVGQSELQYLQGCRIEDVHKKMFQKDAELVQKLQSLCFFKDLKYDSNTYQSPLPCPTLKQQGPGSRSVTVVTPFSPELHSLLPDLYFMISVFPGLSDQAQFSCHLDSYLRKGLRKCFGSRLLLDPMRSGLILRHILNRLGCSETPGADDPAQLRFTCYVLHSAGQIVFTLVPTLSAASTSLTPVGDLIKSAIPQEHNLPSSYQHKFVYYVFTFVCCTKDSIISGPSTGVDWLYSFMRATSHDVRPKRDVACKFSAVVDRISLHKDVMDEYAEHLFEEYFRSLTSCIYSSLHSGMLFSFRDVEVPIELTCEEVTHTVDLTNLTQKLCSGFCNHGNKDAGYHCSFGSIVQAAFWSRFCALIKCYFQPVSNMESFYYYHPPSADQELEPSVESSFEDDQVVFAHTQDCHDDESFVMGTAPPGSSGVSGVNMKPSSSPLFLHIIYSLQCRNENRKSMEPILLPDLPLCAEALWDQVSMDFEGHGRPIVTSVTMDLVWLILPEQQRFWRASTSSAESRLESFSLNSELEVSDDSCSKDSDKDSPYLSELQADSDNQSYDSSLSGLSNIPEDQKATAGLFHSEVLWLITDQEVVCWYQHPPSTMDLIEKVIAHIRTSPRKANCIMHPVPVLLEDRGHRELMLRLQTSPVLDRVFVQVGNYFVLAPAVETKTTGPEEDVWRLIFIVLHVEKQATIYVHSQDESFLPEELSHSLCLLRVSVCKNVENVLQKTCKVVNQKILLDDLYDTRKCNPLLLGEEPGLYHTHDRLTNRPLSPVLQLCDRNSSRDSLECALVWRCQIPLHYRLFVGPGTSRGSSRALSFMRQTLNLLAVNNVPDMFVYKDSQGNVFYFRCFDISENPDCNPTMVSDTYEQSEFLPSDTTIPRSGSITSADLEPRSRPDTDVSNLSGCSTIYKLEFCVYGLSELSEDIKQSLMSFINSRLEEATLQSLSCVLLRNPSLRLTSMDVAFIQPPGKPADAVFSIQIPSDVLGSIDQFAFFFRQSMMQQSFSYPRYMSNSPEHHFKLKEGTAGMADLSPNDAYIYVRSPGLGDIGLALISCEFVFDENQISLDNVFSDNEPDSVIINSWLTSIELVDSADYEDVPHMRFSLWIHGEVRLDTLQLAVAKALKHACCDLWVEAKAIPLFPASTMVCKGSTSSSMESTIPSTAEPTTEKKMLAFSAKQASLDQKRSCSDLSPVATCLASSSVQQFPSQNLDISIIKLPQNLSRIDCQNESEFLDSCLSSGGGNRESLSEKDHTSRLADSRSAFIAGYRQEDSSSLLNPLMITDVVRLFQVAVGLHAPAFYRYESALLCSLLHHTVLINIMQLLKEKWSDMTFVSFSLDQTSENPLYAPVEDLQQVLASAWVDSRVLIVGRNTPQIRLMLDNPSKQESSQLYASYDAKGSRYDGGLVDVAPPSFVSSQTILRNRLALIKLEAGKLTLMMYNLLTTPGAPGGVDRAVEQLVSWTNTRSRLLYSLSMQKLGLFHHSDSRVEGETYRHYFDVVASLMSSTPVKEEGALRINVDVANTLKLIPVQEERANASELRSGADKMISPKPARMDLPLDCVFQNSVPSRAISHARSGQNQDTFKQYGMQVMEVVLTQRRVGLHQGKLEEAFSSLCRRQYQYSLTEDLFSSVRKYSLLVYFSCERLNVPRPVPLGETISSFSVEFYRCLSHSVLNLMQKHELSPISIQPSETQTRKPLNSTLRKEKGVLQESCFHSEDEATIFFVKPCSAGLLMIECIIKDVVLIKMNILYANTIKNLSRSVSRRITDAFLVEWLKLRESISLKHTLYHLYTDMLVNVAERKMTLPSNLDVLHYLGAVVHLLSDRFPVSSHLVIHLCGLVDIDPTISNVFSYVLDKLQQGRFVGCSSCPPGITAVSSETPAAIEAVLGVEGLKHHRSTTNLLIHMKSGSSSNMEYFLHCCLVKGWKESLSAHQSWSSASHSKRYQDALFRYSGYCQSRTQLSSSDTNSSLSEPTTRSTTSWPHLIREDNHPADIQSASSILSSSMEDLSISIAFSNFIQENLKCVIGDIQVASQECVMDWLWLRMLCIDPDGDHSSQSLGFSSNLSYSQMFINGDPFRILAKDRRDLNCDDRLVQSLLELVDCIPLTDLDPELFHITSVWQATHNAMLFKLAPSMSDIWCRSFSHCSDRERWVVVVMCPSSLDCAVVIEKDQFPSSVGVCAVFRRLRSKVLPNTCKLDPATNLSQHHRRQIGAIVSKLTFVFWATML